MTRRPKSPSAHPPKRATSQPDGLQLRVAQDERLLAEAEQDRAELRRRLESAERRFEDLSRAVPGIFFQVQCNPDMSQVRVDFVSFRAREVFGVPGEAIVDNPGLAWNLIHADDRGLVLQALREPSSQCSFDFECRIVVPAEAPGQTCTRWVRVVASATRSSAGEAPTAFVGTVEDITARKLAEESVRASERQFRQLAENIKELFWVSEVDPRRILYISPAYRDMWGRTPESLHDAADSFLEAVHPDDRRRVEESLPKARLGNYDEVYRVVHQDGSIHTVRARAFPIRNDDGEVYRIAGIVEDITETKHVEEELQAERRFLEHLLQVQEGERKLVAYDIHDGFVQLVIAAVMHLEALGVDPDLHERTHENLKLPLKLLRNSIEEARRMISGLRPPIIDEQGLVAAIEYLIHEVPRQDAEVSFEHPVDFQRLDPVLEGALFRIVQEALTNVHRHSQAKAARVSLTQNSDRLKLVVEDSGVGFDPEQVTGRQFGLRGIRERARLVGGTAAIDSTPGKGTRISVEVPLTSLLGDSPSA